MNVERLEQKLAEWVAAIAALQRPETGVEGLVLRTEGDDIWLEDQETGEVLGLTTRLALGAERTPEPDVD